MPNSLEDAQVRISEVDITTRSKLCHELLHVALGFDSFPGARPIARPSQAPLSLFGTVVDPCLIVGKEPMLGTSVLQHTRVPEGRRMLYGDSVLVQCGTFVADYCLANLSTIESAATLLLIVKRFSFGRRWFVSEEKLQTVVSPMLKKTSVCHHSLQEAFLARGSTSPGPTHSMSGPFHHPHIDACGGQSPGCFSRDGFGVDCEVAVQLVEHVGTHVATVWVYASKTKSSTMHNPVLPQRILTLCGIVVSSVHGFSSKTVTLGAREPASTMS